MQSIHNRGVKRSGDAPDGEEGDSKNLGGPKFPYVLSAASLVIGVSHASRCSRGQVGCALYDYRGRLAHVAFNDNIPDPGCDHPEIQGGCGCVHAEIRAIASSREKGAGVPYLAVISRAPCVPCTKALIYAGVRHLWFVEESWPWPDARKIWDNPKYGLKWAQIKTSERVK